MTTIILPEPYRLTYAVTHEAAWFNKLKAYGHAPDDGHPSIAIHASHSGGGVKWEFSVTDYELPHASPSLRLDIFDEGWEVFEVMAPFFAALASGSVKTIEDVRDLLDSLGAADITER